LGTRSAVDLEAATNPELDILALSQVDQPPPATSFDHRQ
jgi:hypothetical protein